MRCGISCRFKDRYKNIKVDIQLFRNKLKNNKAAMIKKYKLFDPVTYTADAEARGHHFMKGMASLENYHKSGATSEYGSYSAGEMFAEAVADVYAHGKQARAMSIALVKEYEKRQKEKTRERYKENKKSWWRRFFGF